MLRLARFGLLCLLLALGAGCVLTRVVTMPMRVVGGICTLVPFGVGDAAHGIVDQAADWVDEIPI